MPGMKIGLATVEENESFSKNGMFVELSGNIDWCQGNNNGIPSEAQDISGIHIYGLCREFILLRYKIMYKIVTSKDMMRRIVKEL